MKLQSSEYLLTRRMCLAHFVSAAALLSQQKPPGSSDSPNDWVCPMDPDVHAAQPGVCPRCGMKLVLHVPDRIEYPLEVTSSPAALRLGEDAALILRVLDPDSNRSV